MFNKFQYIRLLDALTVCIRAYQTDSVDTKTLLKATTKIQNELNALFTDIKCRNVIISNNYDNEFFGIIVRPESILKPTRLLIVDDTDNHQWNFSLNGYLVDIDSKLLSNPDIEPEYLLCMLIYDIDKIMSSDAYITIQGMVDNILSNMNVSYKEIVKYINNDRINASFSFAIYETLYRTISIFTRPSNEVILTPDILKMIYTNCDVRYDGDPVLVAIHFMDDSVDLIKNITKLENDNICPTLILNWFFTWAKNYNPTDTYPIKLMERAKVETGSEVMKRALNKAIQQLGAPYNKYTNQKPIAESTKKGFIAQMKYSGMKSLEDDLYEYSMRVKNIDDENSAILLMRQINSRMGIISDYLESEDDLSDSERKRWEKLYDKYDKIRDQMIAKPIYSRKMYGLFVDYNALMNMNNPQNFTTMNTMY